MYRLTVPALIGPGPRYDWLLSAWRVVINQGHPVIVGSPLDRLIIEHKRRISA